MNNYGFYFLKIWRTGIWEQLSVQLSNFWWSYSKYLGFRYKATQLVICFLFSLFFLLAHIFNDKDLEGINPWRYPLMKLLLYSSLSCSLPHLLYVPICYNEVIWSSLFSCVLICLWLWLMCFLMLLSLWAAILCWWCSLESEAHGR